MFFSRPPSLDKSRYTPRSLAHRRNSFLQLEIKTSEGKSEPSELKIEFEDNPSHFLGEGGFGKVRKASTNNDWYVVKTGSLTLGLTSDKIFNEVHYINEVYGAGSAQAFYFDAEGKEVSFGDEKATHYRITKIRHLGNTLYKELCDHCDNPVITLLLYIRTVEAVIDLHNKGIGHGDPNPGNFIIIKNSDEHMIARPIDFTFSDKLNEDLKNTDVFLLGFDVFRHSTEASIREKGTLMCHPDPKARPTLPEILIFLNSEYLRLTETRARLVPAKTAAATAVTAAADTASMATASMPTAATATTAPPPIATPPASPRVAV